MGSILATRPKIRSITRSNILTTHLGDDGSEEQKRFDWEGQRTVVDSGSHCGTSYGLTVEVMHLGIVHDVS